MDVCVVVRPPPQVSRARSHSFYCLYRANALLNPCFFRCRDDNISTSPFRDSPLSLGLSVFCLSSIHDDAASSILS